MINKELAEELNIPPKIQAKIQYYQEHRRILEEESREETTDEYQKYIYEEWMATHRILQHLWGFDLDDNKIKFWDFPACSCPAMDNNDAYPYGYYAMSGGCMIHGSAVQDNVQDVTNGDVFDALGINTDLSNANTFKEK